MVYSHIIETNIIEKYIPNKETFLCPISVSLFLETTDIIRRIIDSGNVKRKNPIKFS